MTVYITLPKFYQLIDKQIPIDLSDLLLAILITVLELNSDTFSGEEIIFCWKILDISKYDYLGDERVQRIRETLLWLIYRAEEESIICFARSIFV